MRWCLVFKKETEEQEAIVKKIKIRLHGTIAEIGTNGDSEPDLDKNG